MTTTQIKAAAAHARWTLRTFGRPNETQAVKIAASFAARRGTDAELTYMAMSEVWG